MADNIIKLKVDSDEYEGKIKRASQGLQALGRSLHDAGKTFADADEKQVEFARELGKMQTVSNTARGKINELSAAFVNLKSDYLNMADAEKQSPIGQAMANSLDELKNRTIAAKRELEDLNKELNGVKAGGGGGGGLFSGDKLSGMLQVFGGNLMTKGFELAQDAAMRFVNTIKEAAAQGIEMAKAGEGVRLAFERLNQPELLNNLRESTHGTVTDLELMKAAVKFNDFKLPLDQLGTMLAFAQQKAKDTGQSVDYLVNSIVNGLGRKSKLILDNLGISATEIDERMAETGDMTKAVGEIIRDQMAKAGDYVETAADRAAQANVSLQNKMEEFGRKFAPLEEASNQFWTSMKIGILDVIGGPLTNLLNKLTEAGRLMNAYGQIGGSGKVGRMTQNLSNAREDNRQNIYQQQQEQFWRYINPREQQIKDIRSWQRGERNEALQGRISAITEKYGSLDATKIQAEVDAAKKMLSEYQQAAKTILNPIKADIDTSGAEQNLASLNKKLKELQEQRKKAIADGDTDLSKSLLKQINQVKADIKGLGGTTSSSTSNKTQSLRDRIESQWLNAKAKTDFMVQQDLMPTGPNKNSGYDMMREYIEKNIFGVKDWDYKKDITEKDYRKLPGYKDDKNDGFEKFNKDFSKVTSGVGSIVSGIQSLGIELPKGLQSILGVLQGMSTIMSGISVLVSLIKAEEATQTITSFIPHARGGVIRAAGGYEVPGTHFSGDVTPILANAGEVVLNRAQVGGLKTALEGAGTRNVNVSGVLRGTDIVIAVDRSLQATGRGELVTWGK